jgi:hypothetical protein
MDFQNGAALLAVYVKHVEANPDADILDLEKTVGHVRLSLLHHESLKPATAFVGKATGGTKVL